MTKSKPIASISLDLDDQWSYMKIHGDKGWESFPSYLNIFLPYILNVLDSLELKITFFIVGQDAVLENNREVLASIVKRGHEVGNHSFHHESWLKEYSGRQIEQEIQMAEDAIVKATGSKPIGFRGPGFSWSTGLLDVLHKRGYIFDASTLPTFIGPIARIYYFWKSNLSKEERKGRKELFGSFRDGLRPVKPYFWQLKDGAKLLEIPVTTMPVFRTPFHMSYLLYISRFSMPLMKLYLNFSVWMCRLTKTAPSILLHPLDLISGDEVPELNFFPGMDVSSERKIEVFNHAMKILKKHFQLVTLNTHASRIHSLNSKLSIHQPY